MEKGQEEKVRGQGVAVPGQRPQEQEKEGVGQKGAAELGCGQGAAWGEA